MATQVGIFEYSPATMTKWMRLPKPKSGDPPVIDSKDLQFLKWQVAAQLKALLRTADVDRAKYQTEPVTFEVALTGTSEPSHRQLMRLLELDGWNVRFEPCGLHGKRMVVSAPPQ